MPLTPCEQRGSSCDEYGRLYSEDSFCKGCWCRYYPRLSLMAATTTNTPPTARAPSREWMLRCPRQGHRFACTQHGASTCDSEGKLHTDNESCAKHCTCRERIRRNIGPGVSSSANSLSVLSALEKTDTGTSMNRNELENAWAAPTLPVLPWSHKAEASAAPSVSGTKTTSVVLPPEDPNDPYVPICGGGRISSICRPQSWCDEEGTMYSYSESCAHYCKCRRMPQDSLVAPVLPLLPWFGKAEDPTPITPRDNALESHAVDVHHFRSGRTKEKMQQDEWRIECSNNSCQFRAYCTMGIVTPSECGPKCRCIRVPRRKKGGERGI
ncbi:hypothetical protein B0T16DRAFT_418461 [Cercophora newfieldiana]|uniref:Uncharacterized protein n=1 Tax=Cercophora newfieldiana TaxID=92897 RepID=A0AA40CKV9_9PEZI|nr:hypothetical protein B0T16DRAFT_418461 [Cercophora newfieldiana]